MASSAAASSNARSSNMPSDAAWRDVYKAGSSAWHDASAAESSASPEKRLHPLDDTNTPYTYAEFKKYSLKNADKMWKEAKPVEKFDCH